MTPQELRDIAKKVTQHEYDSIIAMLTAAATQGNHSTRFDNITDAVKERLRSGGYTVDIDLFAKTNKKPPIIVSWGKL